MEQLADRTIAGHAEASEVGAMSADRLRSAPRGVIWAIAASCSVGLLVASPSATHAVSSLVLLNAMAVATAFAPSAPDGGRGLVAALPAGFTVVVMWALVWGLFSGLAGSGGWSTRSGSVSGVILLLALTGAVVAVRGGRLDPVGRNAVPAAGFAVIVGFFGLITSLLPFEQWARSSATGSDFMRHLQFVRDLRLAGAMEFSDVTYPHAFHAVAALAAGSLNLGNDLVTLWRVMLPLVFMMLALMLLSLMVVAQESARVLARGPGSRWAAACAAVLAAAAFVQTAWFDVFLSMGNIMNIMVAVALLGMLAFATGLTMTGAAGWLVVASTLVVVANAWQLLFFVAALGALPWIVDFLRHSRRHVWGWLLWILSVALVIHGLGFRLTGGRGVQSLQRATVESASMLSSPGWWWWAAFGLSVSAAAIAFKRGWRRWSTSFLGMVMGGILTTAALMHSTGSSWERPLYYPAKAIWTSSVLLIPLAAAALVSLTWWLIGRASVMGRTKALSLRLVMAGVAVGLVAGCLGRGFAFQPHLVVLARGGPAAPVWPLAALDALPGRAPATGGNAGVLVFGIVPGADPALARSSYLGTVDYKVQEALFFAGVGSSLADPVKLPIVTRDVDALCNHLIRNPDTLRVTGPNPDAGPWWLIGSGCPEEVVMPERWVSLAIDRSWLTASPWDSGSWRFPTYAEVFPEEGHGDLQAEGFTWG